MEIDDAVRALSALAQKTRLEVFRLLVKSGPEGQAPGRLAPRLGLPPATLSFHLKELRGAGLILCRQEGRSRIYQPDFEAMNELATFLTENCCQGFSASTSDPLGPA